MTIREFKIGDLSGLQDGGLVPTGITYPLHVYESVVGKEIGWAYSIIDGDRVVGCAGIISLWAGVGEAWSFLSAESRKPFFIHRVVKRNLLKIMLEKNLHRVQMNVLEGFSAGCRWAEALGFKQEGILHNYTTDKKSFMRYALWR